MKTGETGAVNATVSLFLPKIRNRNIFYNDRDVKKNIIFGGVPMEYLGNAMMVIAIIVTAAVAIVWTTKTIYEFIVKSRKEEIKEFKEPLKNLMNNCVKMSDALCKITTKELEKMNSEEDND